jgi:hypothetical protein
LLETVAVAKLVPPLVHELGAVDCGPKTLNVIVPPPPAVAPERPAATVSGVTAVPTTSACGQLADSVVALVTTVDAMPAPQVLADGELFESPL